MSDRFVTPTPTPTPTPTRRIEIISRTQRRRPSTLSFLYTLLFISTPTHLFGVRSRHGQHSRLVGVAKEPGDLAPYGGEVLPPAASCSDEVQAVGGVWPGAVHRTTPDVLLWRGGVVLQVALAVDVRQIHAGEVEACDRVAGDGGRDSTASGKAVCWQSVLSLLHLFLRTLTRFTGYRSFANSRHEKKAGAA